MKKVFLDTNKIFGLFRQFLLYWWRDHSFILDNQDRYIFCVSTFVLTELLRKSEKINHDKATSVEVIKEFYSKLNLRVIISKRATLDIGYVRDYFDLQILADCIDWDCSLLLTNNLKDFHSDLIEKDFSITVTNSLF